MLPEHTPAVIPLLLTLTVSVAGAVAATTLVAAVALSQFGGQFIVCMLLAAKEKVVGSPVAVSWISCEMGEACPTWVLKTSSGGPAVSVVVLVTARFTMIGTEYKFASGPVGRSVIVPV